MEFALPGFEFGLRLTVVAGLAVEVGLLPVQLIRRSGQQDFSLSHTVRGGRERLAKGLKFRFRVGKGLNEFTILAWEGECGIGRQFRSYLVRSVFRG